MTPECALADLSDAQLLTKAKRLTADERRATAALVECLMELDARRLYLGEGCSSLFTYCTQVLQLEEGAAYNRIEAGRAARKFPRILDGLKDASLTLTSVRLLAPHLTAENADAVLEAARHKRKREVEYLVARLRPSPDAPPVVRKLPVPVHTPDTRNAELQRTPEKRELPMPLPPSPPRPAVLAPLAPERYKVQLTVGKETYDKFRRVQDLMRHQVPDGDAAAIFDRALTSLLDHLERSKFAATARPRCTDAVSSRSRNIPAAVRRAVWNRDGGRCAFVGTNGRCGETGFIEFHHVVPFAAGGETSVENLELRCRAHNSYEAEQYFGPGPLFVRERCAERYEGELGAGRVQVWCEEEHTRGTGITDQQPLERLVPQQVHRRGEVATKPVLLLVLHGVLLDLLDDLAFRIVRGDGTLDAEGAGSRADLRVGRDVSARSPGRRR